MDESSFYFEPELDSGVFPSAASSGAQALAGRARHAAESEVAAVLDLSGSVAKLGVSGAPFELGDEKEAVLMAWLQEVEARVVRATPPKLALAFGCHELLVVPIQSPAGLVGVMAVSLPCGVRRAANALETLAAEWALTLEAAERRSSRAQRLRADADTQPAPALEAPDDEIAYAVVRAGCW